MAFTVPLRLHDYMTDSLPEHSRSSRFNAEPDHQSSSSNPSSRTEASPNSYAGVVDSLETSEHIFPPPHVETNITSHNVTFPGPLPITLRAVLAWYPSTDYTRTREQRRATCFRKDQELSSVFTNLFDESYLYPPGSIALESPYLSPGIAPTALLKVGLPDDIIIYCCEWDMLLAESLDFRDRLLSLEIHKRVSYTLVEGVPHGLDKAPNPFDSARDVREYYSRACGELKRIFRSK